MAKTEIKLYNANVLLKGANQNIQYSEEQLKEYLRCAEDPVYFITNYCKIVTLDHGLQPFRLYDCQIEKVNTIHNNRKVILMESRQSGKTTVSAAYILWYTLFQDSKTVAILANKASAAREVLSRYQLMYEHLPKWLQQGVTTWNKGDIELENGSVVFTAATSASGIRGKSCVTADTKVCVENNGGFFYIDIDNLINNSKFIDKENHMLYTVYKTHNNTNNKAYIGFHSSLEENILRKELGALSCFRDGYLGSGKLFRLALEKYGPENFSQEILGVFSRKEEAESFERELVNEEYVKLDDNYNISIGGNVTILRGKDNPFYGKTHTPETIEKIKTSRAASCLPTYQCVGVELSTGKTFKGYSEILKYFGYIKKEKNDANHRRIFIGQLCHSNVISINKKDFSDGCINAFLENTLINSDEHKFHVKEVRSKSCVEKFSNKYQSDAHIEKRVQAYKKWIQKNVEKHSVTMNKINRDPEKIRKTAEKHRGMKRSEETRKNISASLKNKSPSNKGKMMIMNMMTGEYVYVDKNSEIPDGYIKKGVNKKLVGRKSFTDGIVYKLYAPGEEPEGWIQKGAPKK